MSINASPQQIIILFHPFCLPYALKRSAMKMPIAGNHQNNPGKILFAP
jgi:hypothetical protein